MQDYDLTLFPQSRLRFRLGYSRNVDDGPASTTVEGGTEPLLIENVRYTTNSYRMGVDYRGISKTTLSFDEMLTYSKIRQLVQRTIILPISFPTARLWIWALSLSAPHRARVRLRMRPPRLLR